LQSLDPASKTKTDIRLHPTKQLGPIFLTDDGMQIDCKEEQSMKTSGESSQSLEPDSKATLAIRLQPWKHFLPILSTDDGMQIDCRDEQLTKAVLSNRQA
jgi:hypothetical protein